MKKTGIAAALCAALITLLLCIMLLYSAHRLSAIMQQGGDEETYDRNYMLITDDPSAFLRSIYKSGVEEAHQNGDVLQWVGYDSMVDFNLEDEMTIAAAAQPDGIILDVADDKMRKELLDTACGADIPVVLLMNDLSDPGKVSFVGLNNYQIGQLYGMQAVSALKSGENTISVLTRKAGDEQQIDLTYTHMVRTIDSWASDIRVTITPVEVSQDTPFDTEETVRNIFLSDELPDILICLDSVSTECAIQAAIDYNQVGNVAIIGYHASDTILDAVKKGIVLSTLEVDTDEAGSSAVQALDGYLSEGRVSEFFPVSGKMITRRNVDQYLTKTEDTGGEDGK